MNEREALFAAADEFERLVAAVPADAWSAPALGDWDVRSLVGHTLRALTTVIDYLALERPATASLGSPGEYFAAAGRLDPTIHASVRDRGIAAGVDLGDDPLAGVRATRAQLESALAAEPGNPVLASRIGAIALADYLPTRTFELVVHGLDLAQALGISSQASDGLLTITLDVLVQTAVGGGRAPGAIRALTGRQPGRFSLL